MDNALELLVRVQTQGQAALTELANATKQVGTAGQKASSDTTQASDQLTKALVAQIGKYKRNGSAGTIQTRSRSRSRRQLNARTGPHISIWVATNPATVRLLRVRMCVMSKGLRSTDLIGC